MRGTPLMSDSSYKTIAHRGQSLYEEKKSVFYGFAAPVKCEEEALSMLADIKKEYPDARHHVYAYLLRDRGLSRYSDDHEPQGTAGLPTLDAIRKPGLVDVGIVVVRYFGGTLLGTGGLVRAYSRAAADAVADGELVIMREFMTVRVELAYPDHAKVSAMLPHLGVNLTDTVFSDRVELICSLPAESVEAFFAALTEMTAGRALLSRAEVRFDFDHSLLREHQ